MSVTRQNDQVNMGEIIMKILWLEQNVQNCRWKWGRVCPLARRVTDSGLWAWSWCARKGGSD